MRDIIIEKISKEVSKGISAEAQVLYVLAETRKVLKDHDQSSANYPVLSFFCDWSLHVRMDRREARQMLDRVQDFYRGLDSYLSIRKNTSFFPFVMLIVLRRELRLFFERNSLSLDITNDVKKWEQFLFLLLNVITDCPLISNSGYIRDCKFIDYESRENIICKLKLQDGNTQTITSKNMRDFIEID